MTDLNSTDYYRSRERRERELAEAALNPAIAAIHLDMARRYEEIIARAETGRGARARRRG